ncbi:tail fiber protein [Sodalis ligni]|uniref:tail fiber protein n=1 Tax=Sodalis ligni TaxID=2697027 RepID=UPI00193ECCA7|nr:tail fiber protein [Sodalis ligni]QWA12372.1 tail fiber protein [Sodalis ligni]
MATNNFKPFAVGAGANVTAQADYEALAALVSGFTAGKASSAQVNKALRQSTVLASVLAQFIANTTGKDVLDNGDTTTLLNNLIAALKTNGALSFLQTANNFSEIKSAGATAVSAALANLNLGDGSALPVGVPIPYPVATPPAGWLKCNGAVFSATLYPKLAGVFPALTLPDLRGQFIRGWDDGRGVDINRTILTMQTATSIRTAALDYSGSDAAYSTSLVGTAYSQPDSVTKTQPTGANAPNNSVLGGVLADNAMQATQMNTAISDYSVWISVRPCNISFNYIVRAA